MSTLRVERASKKAKKLKLSLSASSGSGKTMGALFIAKGILGDDFLDGVVLIDSERKSASLYERKFGQFSVINLDRPYSPERYIEAIKLAEASGFKLAIIDSSSHEWMGPGGCLEIHAKLGGTFQNWGQVTPRHNAFIDAILDCNMHVICTLRRDEEYAVGTDSSGKTAIRKLGTKEQQRGGFAYEMDVVFEIDNAQHYCKATKDRTSIFDGRPEFVIDESIGKELLDWSNEGSNLEEVQRIIDASKSIRNCQTMEELTKLAKVLQKEFSDNADIKAVLLAKREELTN